MTQPWTILCDCPELSVELSNLAQELGPSVQPEYCDKVWREARDRLRKEPDATIAIASITPPEEEELILLGRSTWDADAKFAFALIGDHRLLRSLGHDLGLLAVAEVAPLLIVLKLLQHGYDQPWAANVRELSALDRVRLGGPLSHRAESSFVSCGADHIGIQSENQAPLELGHASDVAHAIHAFSQAHHAARPKLSEVAGVDKDAVREIILGPARALSDPASKAALAPYDLPLPLEELCTSPSRAASEATRIGFPVRLALASPDLRIWDHPDLAVDGVQNAGQTRDVFRQITALAKQRQPDARVLGISIGRAAPHVALLRIQMRIVNEELVLTELAFADAHGLASEDRTLTVLPTSARKLEQVLQRLEGRQLLLPADARERKQRITQLGDVLLRLTAFMHDWHHEILSLEVHPLAILPDGSLEIREALIHVSDAFTQDQSIRA